LLNQSPVKEFSPKEKQNIEIIFEKEPEAKKVDLRKRIY
jgi:hypothetical protein